MVVLLIFFALSVQSGVAPALIEQQERKEQRSRDEKEKTRLVEQAEDKTRKAAELQARIAAKSGKVLQMKFYFVILSTIRFLSNWNSSSLYCKQLEGDVSMYPCLVNFFLKDNSSTLHFFDISSLDTKPCSIQKSEVGFKDESCFLNVKEVLMIAKNGTFQCFYT